MTPVAGIFLQVRNQTISSQANFPEGNSIRVPSNDELNPVISPNRLDLFELKRRTGKSQDWRGFNFSCFFLL